MSSNTTEHGEHFNESIVNEVILEDMKKNRIDHMKYLPGMETMEESDVMEQIITAMNAYDYDKYTEKDVRRALEHDNRTVEDFQALLSPAALPLLEEIAQAARVETRKHFGNSVYMFTPIDTYRKLYDFDEIIPCSALRNQNCRFTSDNAYRIIVKNCLDQWRKFLNICLTCF